MSKRTIDQRINDYLAEPPDAQFTRNKWKFWYLTLCGFQLLNATLTALVFSAGGQLQNAMGAVVLAVGGLLAWLGVAFMHYSDSADRELAYRVSVLDSITLICVLAHFSFLAWTFGHLKTIQSAESKYEAQATAYNAQAKQVSTDNVAIAAAAQAIAVENRKRARLESDAAFQLRKAAEAGSQAARPSAKAEAALGVGAGLSTSTVELERPTRPDESSAQFLSRWDSSIRLANLAELILAAVTLIYIRVRSSKTNSPVENFGNIFPKISTGVYRSPLSTPAFDRNTKSDRDTTVVHFGDSFDRKKARRKLLDHLGVISSYHPGKWFKADLVEGGIHIRMCARVNTIEETIADTRQSDKLLMAVDRPDFREKLIEELRRQEFEI